MKNFLTISILTLLLFLSACSDNTPQEPSTLPRDPEASSIGGSHKTQIMNLQTVLFIMNGKDNSLYI